MRGDVLDERTDARSSMCTCIVGFNYSIDTQKQEAMVYSRLRKKRIQSMCIR